VVMFLLLVMAQVTAAATIAVALPAISAGVRFGSNGWGPEYWIPKGLAQTTGDRVSSPVAGFEVNDCVQPQGAMRR